MGIAVMADKAKSLLTSTQMRKALCGSLSVIVIMCFIFMMKLECDTHTIIFCIAILVMFSSSVSSKYPCIMEHDFNESFKRSTCLNFKIKLSA